MVAGWRQNRSLSSGRRVARRRNLQGLSLIELLIAFSILATGILFVIGTFPAGYAAVGKGRAMLMATQLAQAYMDEELGKAYDSMTLNQDLVVERSLTVLGNSIPTPFNVSVSVVPDSATLQNSTKATIRVVVSWNQPAAVPGGTPTVRYVRLETTRLRDF